MAIDRRTFTATLLAGLAGTRFVEAQTGREFFLASRTTDQWQHGASIFNGDGEIVAEFDLPARGHGAAIDPTGRHAIVFARRPGTFAAVIDIADRRLKHLIPSRDDRHFYGHGCFSPDGRYLLATENDFDNERGVIGIYDAAARFERIGEFDSHGIGPHEVIVLADGETLAIANGGILTHPSAPRMKLNVASMEPNLCLVRIRDGACLFRRKPPPSLSQLSIRHLSANRHGAVAFAMQWEGPEHDYPPLVGLMRGGSVWKFLTAPKSVHQAMRNYCGSVAFSNDGNRFLVTAPKGGLITEWTRSGAFIRATPFVDASAASPDRADGFVLANAKGEIRRTSPNSVDLDLRGHHPTRLWDNHMVSFMAAR